MMRKLLTLSVVLFLFMAGIATAAYDLSVTAVTVSPSSPVVGQQATINVTVQNIGADNMTQTTETLSLDFGDSQSNNQALPDLDSGASTVLSFTHTYTATAAITLDAELLNLVNDSTASNNERQTTTNVVNTAPVLANMGDATIVVGTAFSADANATDADGHSITYSLDQSPGGSIDANTGVISGWTPSAAGTYTFTVRATDAYGLTDTESFTVTAQASTASFSTSTATVALGGEDQARGVTTTQTFTITNTGTQTLSGFTATAVDSQNNDLTATYNPQISLPQTTLAPGASMTVTVTVTVPTDASSRPLTIGQIQLSATGTQSNTVTQTVTMTLQALSRLVIDKVDIDIEGDEEGVSDGEVFDEVKEGDKITLTITVENRYSDSDDIDIEDVYVQVESEEGDWDIDEESDEKDIDADDDYEFTISFTLDSDLDEDTSDIIIEAFGDDGQGNFQHYDTFTFRLEIEREDDEISITLAELDRDTVQCTDTYVDLDVEVENTGTDDQEEVTVIVSSRQLNNYEEIDTKIELDEGDDWDKQYRIPLPRNIQAGRYLIEVETFFNDDEESDTEVLYVTVECGGEDDEEPDTGNDGSDNENDGGTVIVTTPPPTTGGSGSGVFGQPVSRTQSFLESPAYIVVLAVVALIVLVGIVSLLFSFRRQ